MKKVSLAEKLFKKVCEKEKVKQDLEKRKLELEKQAKDSKLLSEYLDVLSKLAEQKNKLKEDLEPLRVAMQDENMTVLEDKDVKVSIKKDYTKTVIVPNLFYSLFKPTSKTYQRVVQEQQVKGSIKIEDK